MMRVRKDRKELTNSNHGHWMKRSVNIQTPHDQAYIVTLISCSECGNINEIQTPFCPYCGKPMDE